MNKLDGIGSNQKSFALDSAEEEKTCDNVESICDNVKSRCEDSRGGFRRLRYSKELMSFFNKTIEDLKETTNETFSVKGFMDNLPLSPESVLQISSVLDLETPDISPPIFAAKLGALVKWLTENLLECGLEFLHENFDNKVACEKQLSFSLNTCSLNGSDLHGSTFKGIFRTVHCIDANLQKMTFNVGFVSVTDFTRSNLSDSVFCRNFTNVPGMLKFNYAKLDGMKIVLGCEENEMRYAGYLGADFTGATGLDTADIQVPPYCPLGEEHWDIYLNHIGNPEAGSILSSINSISDVYAELKIKLMQNVVVGLQEAKTIPPFVKPALADVLLNNPIYSDDPAIFKFIVSEILQTTMEQANHVPSRPLHDGVLRPLLKEAISQLEGEGAGHYFGRNCGAINQLLYRASKSGDEQIRGFGENLFKHVLACVPSPLVEANQLNWGLDPEFGLDYFFVANNHAIAVDRDHFEKFALGVESNPPRKRTWNELIYATHNGSIWSSSKPADLGEVFSGMPLLDAPYAKIANENRFDCLLNSLSLGEFKEPFSEATRVDNISDPQKKLAWSNPSAEQFQRQDQLTKTFFSHLKNPAEETTTLSDEHLNDVLAAFGLQNSPVKTQAQLLVSLSAVFAKFSSSSFFGTETDSPYPVRQYALALLNSSVELDSNLIAATDLDSWRSRFSGAAFSCSSVLSKAMMEAIQKCGDTAFAKMLANVTPLKWA